MRHAGSIETVLGLTGTGWAAVSAVTAVIVGVAAIASAFLLMRQLKISTETSRLDEGWNLWSEYLHTLITNPELRDAQSFRAACGVSEWRWDQTVSVGLTPGVLLLRNRYLALIESFLNAADELIAGPRGEHWRTEITEHAHRYAPDLLAVWGLQGWERRFNAKLKTIVELSDGGVP